MRGAFSPQNLRLVVWGPDGSRLVHALSNRSLVRSGLWDLYNAKGERLEEAVAPTKTVYLLVGSAGDGPAPPEAVSAALEIQDDGGLAVRACWENGGDSQNANSEARLRDVTPSLPTIEIEDEPHRSVEWLGRALRRPQETGRDPRYVTGLLGVHDHGRLRWDEVQGANAIDDWIGLLERWPGLDEKDTVELLLFLDTPEGTTRKDCETIAGTGSQLLSSHSSVVWLAKTNEELQDRTRIGTLVLDSSDGNRSLNPARKRMHVRWPGGGGKPR